MTYRIFVSHTSKNDSVATAVTKVINDAFKGHIELYLAIEKVVGGTQWKQELKRNLRSSHAIISIVTPDSIHKPWLYIEWAPFWLNGKKTYLLLSENVSLGDLVEPMRDFQVVDMLDPDKIGKFLQALRDDAHIEMRVPFEFVPLFIREVSAAFSEEMALFL